jgi:hypothetical protein
MVEVGLGERVERVREEANCRRSWREKRGNGRAAVWER